MYYISDILCTKMNRIQFLIHSKDFRSVMETTEDVRKQLYYNID